MCNPFTHLREIYTQNACETPSVLELLFELEKKYDDIMSEIDDKIADFEQLLVPINRKIANLELNQSGIFEQLSDIRDDINSLEQDIETLDSTKLDKDTTHTYTLYGKGSSADSQMQWRIDNTGEVGNAIAQRDSAGSVVVPTPTQNGQASNKSYVDLKFGSLSNPNLLVNGDFRVNQRGATTYTSTGSGTNQKIYGCDRLNIYNGASVEIQGNGGINVVFPNRYAGVRYIIETADYEKLLGKTVTFSVKISNSTFNRRTRQISIFSTSSLATKQFSSDGIFSVTATLPSSMTELDFRVITYSNDSNTDTMTIDWWKVELGSIATPFSPRPYAEELAMCQRYGHLYETTTYASFAIGWAMSETSYRVIFNLPQTLRTKPSYNIISGTLSAFINGSLVTPTSYQVLSCVGNVVVMDFVFPAGTITSGATGSISFDNGKLFFDSEIY